MQDMQSKFNQLSTGKKLILVGAVVFIVAAFFFDWWSYDEGSFSYGHGLLSSPGAIWGLIALIAVLVMAGVVIAVDFGNVTMPALPTGWTWGMVHGAGAAILVLMMLLKTWRINSGEVTIGGVTGDASLGGFGLGFFIGLIGAAAVVIGGYLIYTEDKGEGFSGLRGGGQG